MDYELIGKTISEKNQIKTIYKKTENRSQNVACEQKTTSKKGEFGSKKTRHRMNFECIGKTI